MQTISYLLARFSEPSSYAGLGALLALAGLHFSDSDLGQLAQFLAAGCGLAALLLKERGVIQAIALLLALGGSLTACTGANAPTATQIASGAQIVLTATQQAMCQAQSAANLASVIAAAAGDPSAATAASLASTAAGAGCAWVNPTPGTPASSSPSAT
jgi:hypothetical protein